MKLVRPLVFAGALALLAGCAGFPPRSETPVTDEQIASLPVGIEREQLLQFLGPPAEEAAYKNLDESVMSWRLVEPGNQRWLFNAHFDPSGRVTHYSRTLDPAANLGGRGSRF